MYALHQPHSYYGISLGNHMVMTRFEKLFVNRQRKTNRNITLIQPFLAKIEMSHMQDALEIGCGIGGVSAFLAENYHLNVIGTDFDPDQIRQAREAYSQHPQLRFQIEDAAHLSFRDDSFDLVVSQDVFHHIAAWELAVREIARVLRSEGYVIWFDLAFPAWVKTVFSPWVKNYGLYTMADIRSAFEHSGLIQLAYQKSTHAAFAHHQLVLKKDGPASK